MSAQMLAAAAGKAGGKMSIDVKTFFTESKIDFLAALVTGEAMETTDEMKKLEQQVLAAAEQAKREATQPKEKVLFVR